MGNGAGVTYQPTENIVALEAELATDPETVDLRERLVSALALAGENDKRAAHIVWLLRHDPRSLFVTCPFCQLDMNRAPEAFADVEREWRERVAEAPADSVVVRGLATFLAGGKREEGIRLLTDFVALVPHDADAWIDLGRMNGDPVERLRSFQQAFDLGSPHPVLLEWLASASLQAGDMVAAHRAGVHLLERAQAQRDTHGDRLDCDDVDRWARSRALTQSNAEAQALVGAIHEYASSIHWGNTSLGVVAARAGRLTEALEHLVASAQGPNAPRLCSYGPSFALARELCLLDQWDAATAYLKACERFIGAERIRPMSEDVAQRRLPESWGIYQ